MRKFRSPNSGQTALTLQHSTSPRSGYRPPAGHNADGYTMPERVGFKRGGSAQQKVIKGKQFRLKGRRILDSISKNIPDQYRKKHPELKERGALKKGGWIQDVNKSIKKRGTKGKCTPITKKGCTGRAKALAKTFKKMAKKRKGK